MSIITLISDFGLKDHYVGILKGKIYSQFPEVNIVDISHFVSKFNIFDASYLLEVAYHHFPKGTVHVMAVDAAQTQDTNHVALLYDGHYFIGADNGVFGHLTSKMKADKMVQINIHDRIPNGSSDLDVFAAVAAHLAKGGALTVIGKEIEEVKQLYRLNVIVDENQQFIKGNVVYIDDFGNCVTNISQKQVEELAKGRNATLRFFNKKIDKIRKNYTDFKKNDLISLKSHEGNALAIFNEAGFLEIAIYKSNPESIGSASSLLGLRFRDVVTVEFE